jgi:hypothetical protein
MDSLNQNGEPQELVTGSRDGKSLVSLAYFYIY